MLYIAYQCKTVDVLDTLLIATSLVVLISLSFSSKSYFETFTESSFNKIQIQEDVTDLNKSCVLYTTGFTDKSYNPTNTDLTLWKSAINAEHNLKFNNPPLFSNENGFYLGNNTITGPDCNKLGIDFMSVYTILIVCKHGNLPDSNANDIELLKLYATSENSPNGLTLSIKANTLTNVNNVQVGSLQLAYADQPASPCLVHNSSDSLINFDRDVLTFYFLVKENTTFKIKTITEANPSIVKVFEYQPNNSNVTFANNNMRINRLANWNANIYTFAVFNQGLTDDDITQTYNHIMVEYMKYRDPSFKNVIMTYNNTVDTIQNITKCPFNSTVCNNCQMVHKWYDINNVMSSSQQCKTSINDFCTSNKNNPWCQCWDPSNANPQACKLFKGIFGTNSSYLDHLTEAELAEIKKKYGLLDNAACEIVVNNNKNNWKNTTDVDEPKPKDVEVQLPFPSHQTSQKKPVLDYYQKNIMPVNQKSSEAEKYDLSGMKITNDFATKPPVPTNGSNPYFEKFLKVLMPSS